MRGLGAFWFAASCGVLVVATVTSACATRGAISARRSRGDTRSDAVERHPRSGAMTASSTAVPHQEPASACANCHRVEAEEWNGSLHHTAFSDADFQASFNAEPLAFCFDCHAPEAKGRSDVRGAAIGVGCASCHSVADGHGAGNAPATSISSWLATPTSSSSSSTATANTSTSATTTTNCSSCHEFAFPGRTALMQSTVTEHAQSPLAAVSCASCHLPRAADGHRDHRFDVSRNAELLRAAIDVRSQRTPEGVEIALTTRHVGHAMPTGDLFRRLRVAIVAEADDGRLLGEDEVLLARRFDRTRGTPTQTQDDRVFGERRFHVDGAWLTSASRISIEVRYERVAQTIEIDSAGGHHTHPASTRAPGERTRREALFASIVLAQLALGKPAAEQRQQKTKRLETHSTR